ncbi:MAG: 4-alpha-glucanotransferase [Clostridia bacterium]|nr:4-alpha-glucanotransferase [Clostridia bacterium]
MRQSGILMHITSLPSPGGIGDLGPAAYRFADFLAQSGMKIWQVLPVGPTGYGESPYQSGSAFAGNPLLISLHLLREEGLLSFEDREIYAPADPERVNYDAVRQNKTALLRRAFQQSGGKLSSQLSVFRHSQPWAGDYALFSALKEHFGGVMWTQWPDRGIRNRRFLFLWKYRWQLRQEVQFHLFCQYLFRKQWLALRQYCNQRGVSLFGDMPIYVAEDSADTWTHPEIFQLDKNRIPTRVAGVPPDYFSEDGQLWGNPLYRWDALEKKGFSWWVDRMRAMADLYDMVRVDHFIGFGNYYSIPYGAPNARNGEWVIGPGQALFEKLKQAVPDLKIVAEDLGEVSDRVRQLMDWTGYPGMRVLCFGFDGDESNPHFPTNYVPNIVLYTGTHDNDTVRGWAEKASPQALAFAEKTLGFQGAQEAPAAFLRGAAASVADTVVFPMQDVLGLDSSARMNLPGTIGGNWLWRMRPEVDLASLSQQLSQLNLKYHRA